MTVTKVWIHGITGRVGQKLFQSLAQNKQFKFYGGSARIFTGGLHDNDEVTPETLAENLEKTEVIFDFSSSEGNEVLLDALSKEKMSSKKIIIGTTQLPEKQLMKWEKVAKENKHSILLAPNTSIGVLILSEIAQTVGPLFQKFGFDCEIVETHHKKKKDAPSGTALKLAERINKDLKKKLVLQTHHDGLRNPDTLGIHSVRAGDVFGEHVVRFISANEEIALEHKALNRDLFAEGAITLAKWLCDQKPGFFTLEDVKLDGLL